MTFSVSTYAYALYRNDPRLSGNEGTDTYCGIFVFLSQQLGKQFKRRWKRHKKHSAFRRYFRGDYVPDELS